MGYLADIIRAFSVVSLFLASQKSKSENGGVKSILLMKVLIEVIVEVSRGYLLRAEGSLRVLKGPDQRSRQERTRGCFSSKILEIAWE